jgi:NAD(P)H-hydrate epimerase
MMEAAGGGAASFIIRTIERRPISVLCGPGNNGGDGFVVARKLKEAGFPVRVGLLGERAALKGDAALMAGLYDGPVEALSPALVDGAGLIVDALFGTGLQRPIDGVAKDVILAANASPAPTVAIDIASGVDADTGAMLGIAMRAAATVTFISKKPGHLLFPGRALAGAVHIIDIGVRDETVAKANPLSFENHPALWASGWRRPSFDTHKYDRGHVAVVSGPRLRTGAARLAAKGALRAGAGLVTVLTPPEASAENAAQLTAIMLREAEGAGAIAEVLTDKRFNVALIGPAAGVSAATRDSVLSILRSSASAVLDADALTSFEAAAQTLFAALRPDDVLTPHAGEFTRLFPGAATAPGGRLGAARAAAKAARSVVVLKGADTVIAAPDGRAIINGTAPFELATAGSGDVLAGIIAGMKAQGLKGFEAAAGAVFLHSAAGVVAGPGLIAEDLPVAMPQVIAALFAPPAEQQRPENARR